MRCFVAILVAAAPICGCSGGHFLIYVEGDGASNTGYGSSTNQSRSGSDAADGPDGISTSATAGGEIVIVREGPSLGGTSATFAMARFATNNAPAACETHVVGACAIVTCTRAAATDAGYGSNVSAGTVTITGGSAPIAMMPDVNTEYDYSSALPSGGPNVAGGSTLTVVASGAAVPAFTGIVTMPDDLTVTMPVLPPPPGIPTTFSRSVDTPVTWTGGGPGNTYVVLGQPTTGGGTWISCSFPAASGGGLVSAAALAGLTATDINGMPATSLDIFAENSVSITRTGWWVRLLAENPAFGGAATIR